MKKIRFFAPILNSIAIVSALLLFSACDKSNPTEPVNNYASVTTFTKADSVWTEIRNTDGSTSTVDLRTHIDQGGWTEASLNIFGGVNQNPYLWSHIINNISGDSANYKLETTINWNGEIVGDSTLYSAFSGFNIYITLLVLDSQNSLIAYRDICDKRIEGNNLYSDGTIENGSKDAIIYFTPSDKKGFKIVLETKFSIWTGAFPRTIKCNFWDMQSGHGVGWKTLKLTKFKD